MDDDEDDDGGDEGLKNEMARKKRLRLLTSGDTAILSIAKQDLLTVKVKIIFLY